jgi:ATP-binding cassette subfamily B protein
MSGARRFLAPEVVQTSAMDCGPASLKCLLDGFGVPVSYGRLREACQTDVDGTSIDTMEEVAVQLGLEAEQVMVPADHVLLPEAGLLPCIAVVRQPNGLTHFMVLWRRHGPLIQVMDPAQGRRWSGARHLLNELYVHETAVPAAAWLEWAASDGLLLPLERRLARLGLSGPERSRRISAARDLGGWEPLAALDAATRLTGALVEAGGLSAGRAAAHVHEAFWNKALEDAPAAGLAIPAEAWSVRPAPPGDDGEPRLTMRGAVLVSVRGRRAAAAEAAGGPAPLSPELAAALAEPPSRPGRTLLRHLAQDGLLTPAVLAGAMALSAAGVLAEALLFRGLLDLGRELDLAGQRLAAAGLLLGLLGLLLLIELPILTGLLRLGRHLEIRLRMSFLAKIPHLGDRYFQSRLISDMAERSHSLHRVREVPELGGRLLRAGFGLILTAAGIVWLDPAGAVPALFAAGLSVALPLALQPALAERDLRLRTHAGALGRFYFDSLMGLMAIRAHGAERAVRREHETLLSEWAGTGLGLQRLAVAAEGLQALAGMGLAAWLLLGHLSRGGQAGGVLLLVYWVLSLPQLGQQVAQLLRQYPAVRSVTLRLLEPLGAMEEAASAAGGSPDLDARPQAVPAEIVLPTERTVPSDTQEGGRSGAEGVAIELHGVSVRAAGHPILEGLDLRIEPGAHVAIVGPSGAGKSSLMGLLLGWHRPAEGEIQIDGALLDGAGLERLRRQSAWVDPAVQLWNRSFLENLRYGSADGGAPKPLGPVLEAAELRSVLEKLPEGLQTALGEGGALVSGGEGQRVRLGRAMLRPGVRLVLLDEPFRGLDRERRRLLLERARRLWQGVTLLCITHDVGETLGFERVVVIEAGRIAEDGVPNQLAQSPQSRYRALLEAEEAVREGLWSSGVWTRLRLEGGRLG